MVGVININVPLLTEADAHSTAKEKKNWLWNRGEDWCYLILKQKAECLLVFLIGIIKQIMSIELTHNHNNNLRFRYLFLEVLAYLWLRTAELCVSFCSQSGCAALLRRMDGLSDPHIWKTEALVCCPNHNCNQIIAQGLSKQTLRKWYLLIKSSHSHSLYVKTFSISSLLVVIYLKHFNAHVNNATALLIHGWFYDHILNITFVTLMLTLSLYI